jgi:hypothetical protein
VGIAAGLIHATAEHRWRVARGGLARRAETLLDSGGSPNLGLVLTEALALQAATTFVVVFATAWFGERLMGTLWRHLPPFASAGARSTLCAAPWAGAGAVTGALWRRS